MGTVRSVQTKSILLSCLSAPEKPEARGSSGECDNPGAGRLPEVTGKDSSWTQEMPRDHRNGENYQLG